MPHVGAVGWYGLCLLILIQMSCSDAAVFREQHAYVLWFCSVVRLGHHTLGGAVAEGMPCAGSSKFRALHVT